MNRRFLPIVLEALRRDPMADKDDEFLDGDEGASADAGAKEGGKAKAPFASAMIMQILKWVAIVIGAVIFVATISFIVVSALGGSSNKNATITESPEYDTRPMQFDYYMEVDEFRGETIDGINGGARNMYIVKLHIGYNSGDKETQNEIISRTIQIQDALLSWFSKQQAGYLRDVNNREAVREQIRQNINTLLVRPIQDIRFTKFEILSL